MQHLQELVPLGQILKYTIRHILRPVMRELMAKINQYLNLLGRLQIIQQTATLRKIDQGVHILSQIFLVSLSRDHNEIYKVRRQILVASDENLPYAWGLETSFQYTKKIKRVLRSPLIPSEA